MNATAPNRGRRIGAAGGARALFSRLVRLLGAPLHRLAAPILDRIDAGLASGSIDLILPGGRRRLLGGRMAGPDAVVTVSSWRALSRLLTGGSAGWYEAWARGEWASPDPVTLFELFSRNRRTLGRAGRPSGPSAAIRTLGHRLRRNDRTGSRRNIEWHYDLGNDFYAPWLDRTMTYSSALFAEPIERAEPIEAAQTRKLEAVLARTNTQAGDTILEIGCGWGSFAEVAARGGRTVHGLTLSHEQLAYADARLAGQALPGRFSLTDYRDVTGNYDAVVSIEMVEAVGQEYWPAYLGAIARALKPGGRAAIQYILFDDALFEVYAGAVDFIQRYVFPGGLLISESRFRAIAEAVGLEWRDRQAFGPHYAETLSRWRERFDATASEGRLPAAFDDRFVRLWRYYLMYCEGGFRGGGIDVAQVTLVKRS
jgi:cyclopropane-fatty-acyl-phospholipid synthase